MCSFYEKISVEVKIILWPYICVNETFSDGLSLFFLPELMEMYILHYIHHVIYIKYVLNNIYFILFYCGIEYDKRQVYVGPHTKNTGALTEACRFLQNVNTQHIFFTTQRAL